MVAFLPNMLFHGDVGGLQMTDSWEEAQRVAIKGCDLSKQKAYKAQKGEKAVVGEPD